MLYEELLLLFEIGRNKKCFGWIGLYLLSKLSSKYSTSVSNAETLNKEMWKLFDRWKWGSKFNCFAFINTSFFMQSVLVKIL